MSIPLNSLMSSRTRGRWSSITLYWTFKHSMGDKWVPCREYTLMLQFIDSKLTTQANPITCLVDQKNIK